MFTHALKSQEQPSLHLSNFIFVDDWELNIRDIQF